MSATEVALPAEIRGMRFSGQSVASPKTTRPEPPPDESSPSSLPPPHADSAIAPVTPVAMSTALRLLNFTFECLLDPLVRGDGSCLTAPGSPGGLAGVRERALSGSCRDAVGQGATG